MDSIEIKARREALGLNQTDMAAILGVKQITVSHWETNLRKPNDPLEISTKIGQIEEIQDQIIDDLCELAEHSSGVRDSPEVVLRTYRTNEAYWEADAEARENGWPAVLHRSACAWARRVLEEDGIQARIAEW